LNDNTIGFQPQTRKLVELHVIFLQSKPETNYVRSEFYGLSTFVTYLPLSSVVFQELKFAVFVLRQACSPFGHEEK